MERNFWIGLAVGAAAATAAGLLRATRCSLGQAGTADRWRRGREGRPAEIRLKRDEGGGDPSRLMSERTGATPGFERRGGAPGPGREPESSEAPGRPGQRIDYTDPSSPVKPAVRALNLGDETKSAP